MFALFARAARAGVVEAEYRIGRCYLEGSGVPTSRSDSLHWLNRAAGQGHIDAQWLVAALHIHEAGAREGWEDIARGSSAATLLSAGQVSKPDFEAAEKWARQAAEHGSADGQAVLAYILSSGPESMRNLEEAHRWYERSADAGCPQGSLGYARSLARRADSEESRRQIAEHIRRAAKAALAPAIYLLGVLTERGIGIKRDQAAAAVLFRRAASLGNRSGQASWGRALMWGLVSSATRVQANRGRVKQRWPAIRMQRRSLGIFTRRAACCRPIMQRRRSGFGGPRTAGTRGRRGHSACSI